MASSDTLTVNVVSPTQTVFEGEATSVVVPGWDGKIGILPGHAPLMALLGGGTMDIDLPGGGSEQFFLRHGVVKVEENRVTVLSEYAGPQAPEDYDAGGNWLDPVELREMSSGENPLV